MGSVRRESAPVRIFLREVWAEIARASVPAAALDAVRDLLVEPRLDGAAEGPLGWSVVPADVDFALKPRTTDRDDAVFSFRRAAWPLVVDLLRAHGLEVVVQRSRTRLPRTEPLLVPAGTPAAPAVAAAVGEESAVVLVRRAVDAFAFAAGLCRQFPLARTAFPFASVKAARRGASGLAPLLGAEVRVHRDGCEGDEAGDDRYVTGTYHGLYGIVAVRPARILVALDPRGLTGDGTVGVLDDVLDAHPPLLPPPERRYAVLTAADYDGLGPDGRFRLALLFGPRLIRVPPVPAEVGVVWLRTPSCPAADGLTGLEFKQAAYWRNARRNDYIAAVARAVAAGDVRRLKRYGFPMRNDRPDLPEGQRVAVLVEGPEHGEELRRRLPGWMLRRLPESESVPVGHRCIVTQPCAVRRGLAVDVLIVASGGPGPPDLGRFPPASSRIDESVLVVDFDDGFDAQAREQSRRRRAGYLRRGWLPKDCSSAFREVQ